MIQKFVQKKKKTFTVITIKNNKTNNKDFSLQIIINTADTLLLKYQTIISFFDSVDKNLFNCTNENIEMNKWIAAFISNSVRRNVPNSLFVNSFSLHAFSFKQYKKVRTKDVIY